MAAADAGGRKAARTDGAGGPGAGPAPALAPRRLEPVLRSPPGGASASGGVQGLRWYASRMREDDDGDVAEEFLGERPPLSRGGPRRQGGGNSGGGGGGGGPRGGGAGGLEKLESWGPSVPPRVVGLRGEGGVLLR